MKRCNKIAVILAWVAVVASTFSCTSTVDTDKYALEKADKVLSFPVMDEVRLPQTVVFQFDEKGKRYLSFQNFPQNDILIYSIDSQSLVKKLCVNVEGDNSVVGGFGGYYVADMEHIFIPSLYVSTIFVVDTVGNVKQKIQYSKTTNGQSLIPFIPDDKSQMIFVYSPKDESEIGG